MRAEKPLVLLLLFFVFLAPAFAASSTPSLTNTLSQALSTVVEVFGGIFDAVTAINNLILLGRIVIFILIMAVSVKLQSAKGFDNVALKSVIPLFGAVVAFFTAAFASDGYVAAFFYLVITIGEFLPFIIIGYYLYQASITGDEKSKSESWHGALLKVIVYLILVVFIAGFAGQPMSDLSAYLSTQFQQGSVTASSISVVTNVNNTVGSFLGLLEAVLVLMAGWEFIHFLELVGTKNTYETSILSKIFGGPREAKDLLTKNIQNLTGNDLLKTLSQEQIDYITNQLNSDSDNQHNNSENNGGDANIQANSDELKELHKLLNEVKKSLADTAQNLTNLMSNESDN